MKITKIALTITAIAAFTAMCAASDDLTIVSKVTSRGINKTQTVYMSGAKFRTSGADNDALADLKAGTLTALDNKKKEYWETTFKEMEEMFKQMDDQMAKMQADMKEQMKDNPEAAQMMQGMMGGMYGPVEDVKVEKAPGERKVAGYDCTHYILTMGSSMKIDLWATDAIQPPPEMYEARKIFSGSSQIGKRFQKMFDEMRKIKSYPLLETTTFQMMGNNIETVVEATEVKKDSIPASVFTIPADYNKVESPMKEGMREMKK